MTAEATTKAALIALYSKDDTATSESFQLAFATSAPMIKAVMGAYGHAVFETLPLAKAQPAYHTSKRALAGLVHDHADKLVSLNTTGPVKKRVAAFVAALTTFVTDVATSNGKKPERMCKRFYQRLLDSLSESGLDVKRLTAVPATTAAISQGKQDMANQAVIESNLKSLIGTGKTLELAAQPMPDWLKNMSEKRRQAYFKSYPNSQYNPHAAPRTQAPPKTATSGSHAKIAQHLTPKNAKLLSQRVRSNAKAGAAAASMSLDDDTKKGAMAAAQKISAGQELDGNDKRSLFKTAMVGTLGAAMSAGALIGGALLAPVFMSDPNMVHGVLDHTIDQIKNSGPVQHFDDLAHRVTNSAGEYLGKAGHFVSSNAEAAMARAKHFIGEDTIAKLKNSADGGKEMLNSVTQKAHEHYDANVHPHLEKLAGKVSDAADAVKDKATDAISHGKKALNDAKEAINPTPPASNEQVDQAIKNGGNEPPSYDKVAEDNKTDPRLMDNDSPDNVERNAGKNHPMSDADIDRAVPKPEYDYNDEAPAGNASKGPVEKVTEKVGEAVDSAKKTAEDVTKKAADTVKQGVDAVKDGVKQGGDHVEHLKKAASDAGEHVKKAADEAVQHLHKKAGEVIDTVKNAPDAAKNAAQDVADKAGTAVKDAADKAGSAVKDAADTVQKKGAAGIEGIKKGISDFMLDKGMKDVDMDKAVPRPKYKG